MNKSSKPEEPAGPVEAMDGTPDTPKRAVERLLRRAMTTLEAEEPASGASLLSQGRVPEHGDFSSNVALALAKQLKTSPADVARRLVDALPENDKLEKVEIAGPGFINFFLRPEVFHAPVLRALREGDFGAPQIGNGQRVLIELVSANPTGPLHVGHGRNAAYASALARLLAATGHRVDTEYYINDAGRQMDILAVSVWLNHLRGRVTPEPEYPKKAYQGEYVRDIAARWPADIDGGADGDWPTPSGDDERDLDAWIERARGVLGADFDRIVQLGLDFVMESIKDDLQSFKATPDGWFRETALDGDKHLGKCLALLERSGHTYARDGAVWFRSTALGDEKDRVLIRENGRHTYFLADIAYHREKFERGYDRIINIWGADHHGYVSRLRASTKACGYDSDRLEVILLQFVSLVDDKDTRLSMSTRSGRYIALRELIQCVGVDAARFFYLTRKGEQHLEFDVGLALSRTHNNPMYYVQYAHARICGVLRRADDADPSDEPDLSALSDPEERRLMAEVARYPEVVAEAAMTREPHRLIYYLRDFATVLHSYYTRIPILNSEPPLRRGRLALLRAARRVLGDGLALLDISAPERM